MCKYSSIAIDWYRRHFFDGNIAIAIGDTLCVSIGISIGDTIFDGIAIDYRHTAC
jgi:hypothetical protein